MKYSGEKLMDWAEKKALQYLFGKDSDKEYIFFPMDKNDKNYHETVKQFKKLYNSNDKLLRMAAWNGLFVSSVDDLDKDDFTDEEFEFIKEYIRCFNEHIGSYCIIGGRKTYFVNRNCSFSSSRLVIKPIEKTEDLNLYKKHLKNDGDFSLYTSKKLTKENLERFTKFVRPYHFGVYEKESNNLVGMVGLYGYDDDLRKAEAQWYIFKPYRNKGYASEAMAALAERAFSGKLFELRDTGWAHKYRKHYAKIDLIEANIREVNTASQKTAESCGFKYLYTVNRYFNVDDKGAEDGKHYELTPEALKKPDC